MVGRFEADDGVPDEDEVHPRLARHRKSLIEEILGHIHRIDIVLSYLPDDQSANSEPLQALKDSLLRSLDRYSQIGDGRIEPRRRLGVHRQWNEFQGERHEYFIFLDECGHHTPHYDEKFPMFCVCGVIVHRRHYEVFDKKWKAWKCKFLGSEDAIVHEPNIRKRSGAFYREDPSEQEDLLGSLEHALSDLEYTVIAAAIHKGEFNRVHSSGSVDAFLPAGQYLMCITFLMERFAHFLFHQGDHARGHIVAEARGAKEDALVALELTQLQLRGTQFMPARDFRYLISPSVRFYDKRQNSSGLQVADVLARPAAETILTNSPSPERARSVLDRLYDGCQGRPLSYGLKCYPTMDLDGIFST